MMSSGSSSAALGERVSKNQSAFRIGVVDLDEEALARFDHVTGPVGVSRNGILDGGDEKLDPDGQSSRR